MLNQEKAAYIHAAPLGDVLHEQLSYLLANSKDWTAQGRLNAVMAILLQPFEERSTGKAAGKAKGASAA